MTANHEHTPTPAVFRRGLQSMASKYFITPIAREQFLAEYDNMIAHNIAAAEQRGAIKALREAAYALEVDVGMTLSHRGLMIHEDEADEFGITLGQWIYNRADQIAGEANE